VPIIIVVEDDLLVRDCLRGIFEDHGWDVDDYPSGQAFLSDYAPGRGACLLIDARLPGMSGVEVLQALQDRVPRLPAIMISGLSDSATMAAAMKAGATSVIQKPVDREELLREVERVVGNGPDTSKCLEISSSMHAAGSAAPIDDAGPEDEAAGQFHAMTAALPPAGGAESEKFDRYFHQVPLAIIVAEILTSERIIYANPAFERLTGQAAADMHGKSWESALESASGGRAGSLGAAIAGAVECVGIFKLGVEGANTVTVEAYSNIIVGDDGKPAFRLAALVDVGGETLVRLQEVEQQILEKDIRLLEIQHRVKNNLQMITALIRIEARTVKEKTNAEKFDRLAGRINSVQIIYKLLSDLSKSDEIDLGAYLSEIASSVMQSHGTEGIRLDLKVDSYPVSVNVALPMGMVANELLTNALKHAFVGRDRGTITLHSLTDPGGCTVMVADDGVGLPEGGEWPMHGKMGELIVGSLRQNAKADLTVESRPGNGTRIRIRFSREASRPESQSTAVSPATARV
jgi:two-component sensor histidine kinase/CheY-like chemotaxis protein